MARQIVIRCSGWVRGRRIQVPGSRFVTLHSPDLAWAKFSSRNQAVYLDLIDEARLAPLQCFHGFLYAVLQARSRLHCNLSLC
jgi:hypothetical protein